MLLSFAGCMAGSVDAEQVEPGATSSELGIGPGPSALILTPTAGHPAVAPVTAPCATDSDCHVERDNCSECACHVLGATEHMNACNGEKVTCVLDPCADTVALCIQGHCAAESDGVR